MNPYLLRILAKGPEHLEAQVRHASRRIKSIRIGGRSFLHLEVSAPLKHGKCQQAAQQLRGFQLVTSSGVPHQTGDLGGENDQPADEMGQFSDQLIGAIWSPSHWRNGVVFACQGRLQRWLAAET